MYDDYGKKKTQTSSNFSTMLVFSITPAVGICLLTIFVLVIIVPLKLRSELCIDFADVIFNIITNY